MIDNIKESISKKIIRREQLRKLGRIERLLRDPFRALPFYILATISHIIPYKLKFKTLWGTNMTCYLPEGNTFYYYGYCEANLTNFFLKSIKPGNCFFDVGAHVGFYSMLVSLLVKSTGRVVSFEPTQWTYLLLKENVSKLSNVEIINQAVGDTQEIISFHDYGPGYGAYNSLNNEWASTILKNKKKKRVLIATTTLDEYCLKHQITPDVLKIDTEGFEYHVLQGAKKILRQSGSRPRPIVTLEVAGGESWATKQIQVLELLKDWNFKPYEITVDGRLRHNTIQGAYFYDNLAFIPTERISELSYLFKP